tara:strand:+ start:1941 stop:2894 length:954 start_codon:yes stop_codon:yes gene_type:complete
MKNLIKYFIIIFIINSSLLQSQTYSHLSLNDFEISNPSFIGSKDYSHISISSKQSFDLQNKSSNNSSLYGSYFFEDLNFFIGYSLNTFSFSNLGTNQYNGSLSYVYKLNLNNESSLYPFISGNIYIPNKFSDLIFEKPEPLYMLNSYQDKSYVDLNAGLMFKSTNYLMSFSLNNLLKAKLTDEDTVNPLRLKRTLDLNLGYQNIIIRNTLGFAFVASYFYRPSSYNEFNFSEIRLDQVFLLDFGLEIGGFQEFYSNSFSKKIKSIGFNAQINLNQFEIGVNYKNSKSQEISNTENYLGISLRFKFNLTEIENYLNKW